MCSKLQSHGVPLRPSSNRPDAQVRQVDNSFAKRWTQQPKLSTQGCVCLSVCLR
jgi:hypothetical protein